MSTQQINLTWDDYRDYLNWQAKQWEGRGQKPSKYPAKSYYFRNLEDLKAQIKSEFDSWSFKAKQETSEIEQVAENWKQFEADLIETLPTVLTTVKGRYPEYLKPLYILSSATYQTEDKTTSYRLALANKSTNGVTATNSTYLILDMHNNYRGFADTEDRACELAELIIRKPIY